MSKKTDKNIVAERHVNTLALAWEVRESYLYGKASEDVSKMVPQNEYRLGQDGGGNTQWPEIAGWAECNAVFHLLPTPVGQGFY